MVRLSWVQLIVETKYPKATFGRSRPRLEEIQDPDLRQEALDLKKQGYLIVPKLEPKVGWHVDFYFRQVRFDPLWDAVSAAAGESAGSRGLLFSLSPTLPDNRFAFDNTIEFLEGIYPSEDKGHFICVKEK